MYLHVLVLLTRQGHPSSRQHDLLQDGEEMKAKCHFVKVDCLGTRIGKKVPVDMVAIVTDVGSVGRIKRQHDGTEFVRRCVLLLVYWSSLLSCPDRKPRLRLEGAVEAWPILHAAHVVS